MTEPPRDPYERYRPRPSREQPAQEPYRQAENGPYGPYQPQPPNEQAGRPRFIPAGLRPGEPDHDRPDYNQPDYGQPDYGQPGYGQPGYPPPFTHSFYKVVRKIHFVAMQCGCSWRNCGNVVSIQYQLISFHFH